MKSVEEEKEVNECSELHKALFEAEVECQQKFDVAKNFELGLISRTVNVPQDLQE